MLSFKKASLALVAAAVLAGCSSAPSLDNAPVEDKGSNTLGNGAGSGQTGQSTVGGVDLNNSAANGQGPVGVARVIYFDFDKSEIQSQFDNIVACHAKYLRDRPSARLRLEGNADERGSRDYNLGLGERRGNAVSSALQANGGSGSQITVISYGEERPVCNETTDSCWAQNRRVELVYSAK